MHTVNRIQESNLEIIRFQVLYQFYPDKFPNSRSMCKADPTPTIINSTVILLAAIAIGKNTTNGQLVIVPLVFVSHPHIVNKLNKNFED